MSKNIIKTSIFLFFFLQFICISMVYASDEIDVSIPLYDEIRLEGTASWYGPGFHGRTTANGEAYNQFGLTAAHKSLKFGTVLHVTNLANNETVLVQINDRGPYVGKRIIDLSEAAMQRLDGMKSGVINIEAVGVSDLKGVPLDSNLSYYIQCEKTDTEEEAYTELSKLHRVGFFEAHVYPLTESYFVGIGPFDTFQQAQDKLIDLITLFPLTRIKLYSNKIDYLK